NPVGHPGTPTREQLKAVHDPLFATGLGNRAFLRQLGLRRIEELDWWQSLELRRATVTMIPAQHWSGRSGRNRNRTLWGGFMVRAAGRRVLFAGDTGYSGHFRDIQRRLGPPAIALLPIGAYEPRWFMAPQHMNPEEAVRAHL